ncbi:GGDEF domain-containing protein [Amycolatopsis sp. YIM 10]|uniref:sensor domain-containing diguanylate cyclase n=1 Tax=Amycolatopsis sp. YIM 10 TaxID=2653857 RepID=UPI0012908874|nr:GGDEF domain-containing protein [Amycolatopsis sp. YIM 10]QFU93360.1 putative diguanylate cyclase YcdT [Amycolatopsis sp. YIM 10]
MGSFRRPTGWALWSAPRQVVVWVLAVEVAALAATAGTARLAPVDAAGLSGFALLGACLLAHVELSRTIERKREIAAGSGPYLSTTSVWNFAAVIVLPPVLASAMVVLGYGYMWFRVWHRRGTMKPHRWWYSACTVLLANQAAVVVLTLDPGVPATAGAVAVVVAAGAMRWFVNYALICAVKLLSEPRTRVRDVVGGFGEQILEVGAMGLGLLAACVMDTPAVLLVGVPAVLAVLGRSAQVARFRKAAETDGKTQLLNATAWTDFATHALDRTSRRGGTFGVLMIDLDHFKRINDEHGHGAGDAVLKAVAKAITAGVRSGDLVGRFGGEEFVVALPDITAVELLAVGERLRRGVAALPVATGHVSISIGAALAPENGLTVQDLLATADAAMYTAKHSGRNRVEPAAGLLR